MSQYRVSENVIVRQIRDDVFALERTSGHIHSMNLSGFFVWGLLKKGMDKKSMIIQMTEEYGIDSATAEKDLDEFLKSLESKGFVNLADQ